MLAHRGNADADAGGIDSATVELMAATVELMADPPARTVRSRAAARTGRGRPRIRQSAPTPKGRRALRALCYLAATTFTGNDAVTSGCSLTWTL